MRTPIKLGNINEALQASIRQDQQVKCAEEEKRRLSVSRTLATYRAKRKLKRKLTKAAQRGNRK